MNKATYYNGWLQALFSVIVLWGISNVAIRYATQVLDVNYIIFTSCSFIASAFVLILRGGPGNLIRETTHSVSTWGFGLTMFFGYVLTLALFSYVTATEGTLLQRLSFILSILASWFFIRRKPTSGQLIAIALIGAGIGFAAYDLPTNDLVMVLFLLLLVSVAQTIRIFIAETHKPHRRAMTMVEEPKAKARVVGFVMFVVAFTFLFLTFLFATMRHYWDTDLPFPQFTDFQNPVNIVGGLVWGVVLIAPLKLIEFSSTNIIKTENFLTVASLSVIATLFWEYILSPYTGLPIAELNWQYTTSIALVTIGALVAAISKVSKASKDKRILWSEYLNHQGFVNPLTVEETHDIVRRTLQNCNRNAIAASKLLDLPLEVIDMIIQDKEETMAFTEEALIRASRNYRKKIGTTDALTGLYNRHEFNARVHALPKDKKHSHALMIIDIDYFKRVNDTYGHTVGDKVLKSVASALKRATKNYGFCGRWGGEEFVCILQDTDIMTAAEKADNIREMVKSKKFKGIKEPVTISIGLATYKTTDPFDQIFIKADEALYAAKAAGRDQIMIAGKENKHIAYLKTA